MFLMTDYIGVIAAANGTDELSGIDFYQRIKNKIHQKMSDLVFVLFNLKVKKIKNRH